MEEDAEYDCENVQESEPVHEPETLAPHHTQASSTSTDKHLDHQLSIYENSGHVLRRGQPETPEHTLYRRITKPSSVYDFIPAESCGPNCGASSSSRGKQAARGFSGHDRLVLILLLTLMFMSIALQSVSIFFQVSGISVTGNIMEERQNEGPHFQEFPENLTTALPTKAQGGYLTCPDLWISAGNKCYYFSEGKKIHKQSSEYCADHDSRLAMVKEGPIRRLLDFMEQDFWVGLSLYYYNSHEGVWTGRWADGSTQSVTGGDGTCAKFKHNLILENCFTEVRWICEKDIK